MSVSTIKIGDKIFVMNKYRYRQLVNSIIASEEIPDDVKIEQLLIVIDSVLDQYLN